MIHKSLLSIALAATALSGGYAAAQESDDSRLEEITVTASKRGAASVQDIPYNISAVTGTQLNSINASDLSDLSAVVPGLSVLDQGPNDSIPIIRGLATPVGTEQVSIYFDETPVQGARGNSRSSNLTVVDLERVEVLRGPQGTLYGTGSQGGTIRYILNKPDLASFGVDANLSYGNRSRGGGSAEAYDVALNIPFVSDVFGVRVVGYRNEVDGYVQIPDLNIDGSDSHEVTGARLMAKWQIGENTSLLASFTQQTSDVGDRPLVLVDEDSRPGVVLSLSEDEFDAINLTLEHDFGWGRLTATASRFETDGRNEFDVTQFLPPPFAPFGAAVNQPGTSELTSAEVRLASALDGSWQYIAGVFYQDREALGLSFLNFRDPTDGSEAQGMPNLFDSQTASTAEQSAIFGEVSYAVSDRVELLVGARFFDMERFSQRTAFADAFDPTAVIFPDLPDPTQSEVSDSVFRLQASWSVTDSMLAYATVSEGFREGGENAIIVGGASVIPPSYDPDIVRNHELGLKTTLAGEQLLLNTAVYYMTWDDIQVGTVDDTGRFRFTTNAGAADMIGIEIESQWRPDFWPGFSANVTLRLSEQELTKDEPAFALGNPNAGLKGDRIPNTDPREVSISLEQRFSVASLDAFFRLNTNYRGEALTTYRSSQANAREYGDFWMTGFQLGVEKDSWYATLYGSNISDVREPLSWMVESGLPDRITTTSPRQFGIRVGVHY